MISMSYAKDKVIVIDSGYGGLFEHLDKSDQLCKAGHFDFTTNESILGVDDAPGHGTHVVNFVAVQSSSKKYCIIMYKTDSNRLNFVRALEKAIKVKPIAMNISYWFRGYLAQEHDLFKKLTNKGTKVFTIAGNQGRNLNIICNVFPTCYKKLNSNFIVIGATTPYFNPEKYSNFGNVVDGYEFGVAPGGMQGTSFAAPRALGLYLKVKYEGR